MNKNFLLYLFLLLSYTSSALNIQGTVKDSNGQALPYATIFIKGTNIGTSANNEGTFSLDLNPGTHEITCQYLGFEPETQKITIDNHPQTIDFILKPHQLKIEEVLIKGDSEDPAYAMMRNVIENKKTRKDLINSLEKEIYLKGSLRTQNIPDKIMGFDLRKNENLQETWSQMGLDSSGQGIVYLLEQVAHYYYQKPNQVFHKIISIKESGNPNGLGIATMPPVIDIYENNINLLGLNKRGFISPAHSNAFLYYKFEYQGNFIEDNKIINKIKISPRRLYEPLFQGYVYVVENEWVFHSVDLTLTKESQIDVLESLGLQQLFRPLNGNWTIQNQIIFPVLNIIGIEIGGAFLTSYKNQKINMPIDDHIFQNKIISSYDSLSQNNDPEYWDSIRTIPLTEEERINYQFKDSVYVIEKEREDSLKSVPSYHFGMANFLLTGAGFRQGKNDLKITPLISSVQFNTVEGLNLSLNFNYKRTINENQHFKINMLNHYGFSNTHWNPSVMFTYFQENKEHKTNTWSFDLEIGQKVQQINDHEPISPFLNSLYTLIDGRNYYKIFENRLIKLRTNRNFGNGWTFSVAAAYEQKSPLKNTTDYTFSEKTSQRITPNQPFELPSFEKEDAALLSLNLSYRPGWRYIQYPDYLQPVRYGNAPKFSLYYEKGIPSIGNSKSNFDYWDFSITHDLRLRMAGNLNYKLIAGGFLNKEHVHIADWKHINGNQTFIANQYLSSFQLAPYYKYSHTESFYVQGHLEWHLNGLLTNKIPLFKRLNWHAVSGSNALYINPDNYYTEVFVGIENIGWKAFRMGRIDFVAGYESGKSKPSTGIRISIAQSLFGG